METVHVELPPAQAPLQPVKMDFQYQTSFGHGSPDAYERLLLDALIGNEL